jgi:hypothetical protein
MRFKYYKAATFLIILVLALQAFVFKQGIIYDALFKRVTLSTNSTDNELVLLARWHSPFLQGGYYSYHELPYSSSTFHNAHDSTKLEWYFHERKQINGSWTEKLHGPFILKFGDEDYPRTILLDAQNITVTKTLEG